MAFVDAKIAFTLLTSMLLAALCGRWLAGRYRQRMVALMRELAVPNADAAPAPMAAVAALERPTPPALTLADNRRAGWRLTALLAGISLLVAFTLAAIELPLVYAQEFSLPRLLVVAVVNAWPMVPAIGLVWRWSFLRIVAALAAYLLLAALLVLWRSNAEQSPLAVLLWIGMQVLVPMAVVLALSGSARIRAAAPYLLPAFVPLVASSILGVDLLAALVEGTPAAGLVGVVERLGALPTLVLFAIVPWALALWPMIALTRALARRYRRKAFSDVIYLFALWWLIVILQAVLPATHGAGPWAAALFVAWLWIPLGFRLTRRSLPPGPTLLVLRVFQRDRQMAALFDTVITRWRLSGNTLLIAGTDVVSDTMDVDDLFTFVSGRLAERFVTRPADLPRRIAEFDLLPDADGRYRLNECYCSDTTWQAALQALVASARVVLMDLRGFAAHNAGCRFELRVLAESPAVTRVVVLCDGDTDLVVARAEAAQAAPGRFVWFDARALDRAASERVLAELCAGTAGAPAG